MISLLKADLKRMFKDKLFLISCIIAVVFSIITPILYKALLLLFEAEEDLLLTSMFSAKGLLASMFSPTNNLGLIIPVFLGIIINKDFSYGTVRNKIIKGKSRTKVYLSTLISSVIVMLVIMLAHCIITMLFGSLLLGYSNDTTIWKDLPYVITSIALGLLCYLFIACLLVFFGTCMKNFGSALVMYFVVVFILTLVGSLTPFASSFFEVENNKVLKDLFDFISNINIFYYPSNVIGIIEKYKVSNILYLLFSTIIFGGGLSLLGITMFNKKDLK